MNIHDFINKYQNHPVLFLGSGFSFRYLKNTYTWDKLLQHACIELWGNDEKYLDIKASCAFPNNTYNYPKIGSIIEKDFNSILESDRNGKFKEINDTFYENMRNHNIRLSRFKIYIAKLLREYEIKDNVDDELTSLKRARKNIGSIITTNYDKFAESIFEFTPLVGNDILLSNPYGSIYKIHGCVDDISKIIITEEDYRNFDDKYELIRAQMLSMFIHNPIIFLGYNIGDENIKKVLKTIFSYITPNTEQAKDVQDNFLLIEYDKDSENLEVTEHDILVNGAYIRINKLKTDNYLALYEELAQINLPISAMDIRKVQNVVKDICCGGNSNGESIQVKITENICELKNSDMILAIGTPKAIEYKVVSAAQIIQDYFEIIDESNIPKIETINTLTIANNQYFPIFGFSKLCPNINKVEELKSLQETNIKNFLSKCDNFKNNYTTIESIKSCKEIAPSNKLRATMYAISKDQISINDLETYLRGKDAKSRKSSDFRRLLCLYDIKKYKN